MLELCRNSFDSCFGAAASGAPPVDELAWQTNLLSHAFGEYSMAVVQANSLLEDQAQVVASPSATFAGVFDGHGGPQASRFINTNFFPFLQKHTSELGGLRADTLRKAFDTTEREFLQLVRKSWKTNPKIALSGSCCLVAVISNDNILYTGNIGDSRAVLGRKVYGTGMFSPSTVVAERLTSDHNVGDEGVRNQVRALHPDDSHIVVYSRGFWRIKGIIQVSRAIGDIYLKFPEFSKVYKQFGPSVPLQKAVITAEPSISVRNLEAKDLFLILASDGLWEHISDQTAAEIVYRSPRVGIAMRLARAAMQEAAKKRGLVYEDLSLFEEGVRRQIHDDITVTVIYFDHPCTEEVRTGELSHTITPADVVSYNAGALDSSICT